MTTREVFATCMRVLAGTFGTELSAAALEGYWLGLDSLTESEFKAATKRALTECKFMPRPAELLAFAGRSKPSAAAQAILCWEKVRRAIDKHDYLVSSIDFGPRVNGVIANLGGWDMLCKASLPELDSPGWLQKRFLATYEALVDLPVSSLRGEPLSGALPSKWSTPAPPIVVAIEGEPAPLALPPVNPEVRAQVEALADHLSTEAS